MTEPDKSREDFDRRLTQARNRRADGGQTNRQTAFGQAFRLSSEMVAGVLVGGFIEGFPAANCKRRHSRA